MISFESTDTCVIRSRSLSSQGRDEKGKTHVAQTASELPSHRTRTCTYLFHKPSEYIGDLPSSTNPLVHPFPVHNPHLFHPPTRSHQVNRKKPERPSPKAKLHRTPPNPLQLERCKAVATYHAQRSRRRRTTLDLGGTVNAAALCVTWRRRGWGVTRLYRWTIDIWISMY